MVHRYRARAVQQIRDVAHTLHSSLKNTSRYACQRMDYQEPGQDGIHARGRCCNSLRYKNSKPRHSDDSGHVEPVRRGRAATPAWSPGYTHHLRIRRRKHRGQLGLSGQQSDKLCWVGGKARVRRHMGTYRGAHARHRNGSRQVSASQFDRQHLAVPALADCAPFSRSCHHWTLASARGRAERDQGQQIQRPQKRNDRSILAS